MRFSKSFIHILLLWSLLIGAKGHVGQSTNIKNKELKYLDLKFKKEISDKKLSIQKRYLLCILAARELKELNFKEKSNEYYRMAKDFKVEENKKEIIDALNEKIKTPGTSIFYFEVNISQLVKNKNYEKAILSLNPENFIHPENEKFKILYDLLNVRIRKRSVKKLYCYESLQRNPEDYQYSNLLCDLLESYLHDGKINSENYKVIEEYFFKHDLKERYLLQLAKELKTAL